MNERRILPFQGWRLVMFQAIVVFSLLILVLRLGELQFQRGEQFVEDAEENRLQLVLNPAPRGWIYDRNGVPLAQNDPAYNVTIVPADLPDDPDDTLEVYNRLSALIDVPATRAVADAAGRVDERSIDEMVREGEGIAPYRAVTVARDVPHLVAFRIQEEAQMMPGVGVQVSSVREYPTGALTAHLVGYLGPIGPDEEKELRELGYDPAYDRIGYAGIESYLEEALAGQRGMETWIVDVAGQPLRLIEEQPFTAGVNANLTLDVDLQIAAQKALTDELVAENDTRNDAGKEMLAQGVVIAMDPRNGQILALVSWPSYDNTRFARSIDGDYYFSQLNDPLKPLVNHAISALYPPGSTWKLITSTGVVEEDVIDPYQTLFCPGSLVLPNAYAPRDTSLGQTFVCWLRSGHKDLNLIGAIAQSCDVYFYQVGGGNPEVSTMRLKEGGLGINDLYRWATAYGIGSQLGVQLPGELAGRMPDADWKRRNYGESWSTGDTYNAAFGQGYVTVTPLQLVTAVAAIANGGTLYQPQILKNLTDAEGNVMLDFPPTVARTLALPTNGDEPVLLLQEDMLINGPNSVACRCELDADDPDYDEAFCESDEFHNQVDIDPNLEDEITNFVRYRVSVLPDYEFDQGVCDVLEYSRYQVEDSHYIPPFADPTTFDLIHAGMREVIISGTASDPGITVVPPLDYVNEAGKTGTAEYCDDIAFDKGLCVQGQWPSHAWYVGYAPYENPEIIVVAFVYDGGEGSMVSTPIVRHVMDAYFKLKQQRAQQ